MRMMVLDVAQHQRGRWQPGDAAQRTHHRLQDEVAVALSPARGLVAGHRLHIDVEREQIIAGMRFLVGTVDEEAGGEAFAREAPLQVGEAD